MPYFSVLMRLASRRDYRGWVNLPGVEKGDHGLHLSERWWACISRGSDTAKISVVACNVRGGISGSCLYNLFWSLCFGGRCGHAQGRVIVFRRPLLSRGRADFGGFVAPLPNSIPTRGYRSKVATSQDFACSET